MPFRSAPALPAAIVVVTLDPAASADVVGAVGRAWPGVPVHLRGPDRPFADGACSAREPVAVVLDLPAAALDHAVDTAIEQSIELECIVGLAVIDRGLAGALDAEQLARLDQRVPCQLDPATTDTRAWRRHLHAIVREALESAAHQTLAHDLHRTLDTLRLAQEAGRVGVFDWDAVARRGTWSDGLYDLCGVARGTPVTPALRTLLLPREEGDRLVARLADILAAREDEFELDVRIVRRADEAQRWLWCRGRVRYDAAGAPLRLVGTAVDVTHERLAREAVHRAESRLLAMYDAAEAGIVHTGLDGTIKYVNGAFARLVGRDAHRLLAGTTVDDLTDPDDHALERAVRAVHGVSGAPFDFQKRFVRPDGTRIWTHVTGGIIRDSTGRNVGAIGIVVDITARRAAERALRDSEEQLRQAAGLAGLVSGELDLLTGEVTGNGALARFLGLDALPPKGTLTGLLAAVHHHDRADVARRVAAALDPAGDGRLESEHRFLSRAGEARWHQVRGQVRFEGEGNGRRPVRFLFTGLDVTDRRRQEEEGRVREERLALAFGALRGLVYDWDARTGATMRSGEMAHITGWRPEEVPDDVTWWHTLVHDDDVAMLRDAWLAYEHDGAERMTQEYRIRHRDGHWVWVQDHSRAVRAADGSLERLIGITIGIDDRKRAEERIEVARREAEAANAAKDRFLAVLSHELRTPLAPVALLTTMLQRRADLPRDAHAHLGTIRKNVELQIKLIDDLLDLTRIARGKLELRLGPVALGPAIEEVLAMVAADADARQLRLVRTGDAHGLRVRADSARLQQMLWNLVRNAVKFTPACGTVTVHAAVDGDTVRVTVTDTGIGIAADQLAKVFDPFVQADPMVTREFGGLGLGLYITRALAQQHGGDIVAESDGPGTGARFTLALPLAAPEPLPTTTAEIPRDALATTRGAGRRILLVEDHEDTAAAVATILRTMDFDPVVAHSVGEGLRRFHAERDVAAVITDLGLPDGSGAELLQHLQSSYGAESLPPCLVMSGFGMQHDIERSLALGFAAHLVKPVSAERLAEALGAALERPRAIATSV